MQHSLSDHKSVPDECAHVQVLILGGGPNRIGQGIEFDYCCCHASFALRQALGNALRSSSSNSCNGYMSALCMWQFQQASSVIPCALRCQYSYERRRKCCLLLVCAQRLATLTRLARL